MLVLSGNPLGDVGLAAIARSACVGSLGALRSLLLSDCQVGDRGVCELAALPSSALPALALLDLTGNHGAR